MNHSTSIHGATRIKVTQKHIPATAELGEYWTTHLEVICDTLPPSFSDIMVFSRDELELEVTHDD